jgi:hypothetical protein
MKTILFLLCAIIFATTINAQSAQGRLKGKGVKMNPPTTYWNTEQEYEATCPANSAGTPVTVVVLAHTYSSTVSQSEANSIALSAAQTQALALIVCTPNPTVYQNTEQSYIANCPDGTTGDPVEVIKAAGTYQSFISVSDANAIALAAATNEANAALVCTPTPTTYTNTEQSYTANCPSGDIGDPVTVTKLAGTYTSLISVADANSKALAAATAEANAALACTTVYYNTEQSFTANCPSGYTGTPVTVTKLANTYQSFVSIADANSQALAAATAEANAALVCNQVVYYNLLQTYTANCPEGFTGTAQTVTKAAGTYSSTVSIAQANAAALAAATAEANAALVCAPIPTVYVNTQQSFTASCPSGFTGTPVTVTKTAGTYSSTISVADANTKALAAATAEAQAALTCTPIIYGNTSQSYTANCPSGTTGNSVTVTKAANTYTSAISIADANAKALAAATSEAIAQLNCQTTSTNLSAFPALATPSTPGISAPGDAFAMNAAASPSGSAPQLAEWSRVVNSGDNIIYSAFQNSAQGTVKIYKNGTGVVDGVKQVMDTEKGVVTIPASLGAFDVFAFWVGNASGYGTGKLINNTISYWCQTKVAVGITAKVYGKNLAHGNVDGTNNSYVYLKPAGGGSGTYATVTKVSPYYVEYIVPSIATGAYKLWLHNGHGGDYGWATPLDVTIVTANNHVKTRTWGSTYNVLSYGATPGSSGDNDATAIQNAINAANTAGGGIVYIPAGTYDVSSNITLKNNVKLLGDISNGVPTSIIKCKAPFTTGEFGMLGVYNLNMIMMENIYLNQNAIQTSSSHTANYAELQNPNMFWVKNCYWDSRGYAAFSTAGSGATDTYFEGTTIIGGDSEFGTTLLLDDGQQIFFDNCNIRMTNDCGAAILNKGVTQTALYRCDIRDLDNTTTNGSGWGKGRIWSCEGSLGSEYHLYFGENLGYGLGTRTSGTSQPDGNSGEVYLWEANEPSFQGTVSSATSTTATFSSSPGSNGVARGAAIVSGKGLGQFRRITNFSSNTITLESAWQVTPDNTSSIVIGPFCSNIVIDKNITNANGKSYIANSPTLHTASTGVSFYGGIYYCDYTRNNTNGLRAGVTLWGINHNSSTWVDGNFFNNIADNNIAGSRYGIQLNAEGVSSVGFLNVGVAFNKFSGNNITSTVPQTINGGNYVADIAYYLRPERTYTFPYISTNVFERSKLSQIVNNWSGVIFGGSVNILPLNSTSNTIFYNNNP